MEPTAPRGRVTPRRDALPAGAILAIAMVALTCSSMSAGAASPDAGERSRRLAGERGCTVCHRDASSAREADAALALAPTWREIAARYRGQAGAQDRLTRIVLGGADPTHRHWKNRLEFSRMEANPRLTPDEARALVRWILATPTQ
jgi:cytochrome c